MAGAGRRAQISRVTVPAEITARIRIVLARMPKLLRDLLRDALERHPHVLVEEDAARDGLAALVARTHPDGVILGALDSTEPAFPAAEITRALFRSPRTRILLVTEGGTRARVHELTPTHERVTDVTPKGLGAAILERLAPRQGLD